MTEAITANKMLPVSRRGILGALEVVDPLGQVIDLLGKITDVTEGRDIQVIKGAQNRFLNHLLQVFPGLFYKFLAHVKALFPGDLTLLHKILKHVLDLFLCPGYASQCD